MLPLPNQTNRHNTFSDPSIIRACMCKCCSCVCCSCVVRVCVVFRVYIKVESAGVNVQQSPNCQIHFNHFYLNTQQQPQQQQPQQQQPQQPTRATSTSRSPGACVCV